MSGAYRAGADAPEQTGATGPEAPPAPAPPDAPTRARKGRRRRRRPAPPADLADIADATGVKPDEPGAEPAVPAPEPAAPTASDEPTITVETEAVPESPTEAEVPEQAEPSAVETLPEAEEAPGEDAPEPVASEEPQGSEKSEDDWDDDEELASSVRPYSWTGGRTRSSHDLQLETLVSTTDHGRDVAALASIEHRAVAELCNTPRSVAEIASLLELPFGVARVVVGDMAGLDLVAVHDSASGDPPDTALMERVLSGLRRL